MQAGSYFSTPQAMRFGLTIRGTRGWELSYFAGCLSPEAVDRRSAGFHIFDGQFAFQLKEIRNEH
jgi:hypothetical protein